jgi:hypothetical protein
VVGLAALFAALGAGSWPAESFHAWGVVAAPRFLGRTTMATALPKFLAEGAWGVSPHTIPYLSLHAAAGAVSLALRVHGPNFGAGGGPDAEVEALLAAITMLHGHRLPGVLVVIMGWDPELTPLAPAVEPPSVCRAVALALTPPAGERDGLRLSLVTSERGYGRGARPEARKTMESSTPSAPPPPKKPAPAPKARPCRLRSLANLLNDHSFAVAHWPLPSGGELAWRRAGEGSPK